MKLQNLTVIFIIIILPIILLVSFYISTGLKTINYQIKYDTALLTATHDAIYAFEINTAKDKYSDNAEAKREILKSSVKMFEKSLCNGCNISDYNKSEIEKYVPALVFGMYDGFYMYAPSYVASTGKYEHNLKNYVYYSEKFDDGTVITYTLDNYVIVLHKGQEIREGYLINLEALEITEDTVIYNGVKIENKADAHNYYKEAEAFTKWFLSTNVNMQNKKLNGEKASYLDIGQGNDPEDIDSLFEQHKRAVIKEKIESVLNSSITVYSDKTVGYTYKMPKLSVEDWEKVYNNISMISFFQGKDIGFTKYNGYCVLNSTNSNEFVSPNLMYFIHNGEYHDIRCSTLKSLDDNQYIEGHKIGDFQKQFINDDMENKSYYYKYSDLACYKCINGQLDSSKSIREYINDAETVNSIKTSYWTSLAIERYNTTKVTNVSELRAVNRLNIEIQWDDSYNNIPNYNGFRPDSIAIGLFKNDDVEKFMDVEISEEKNRKDANTWYIEVEGLKAYENNAEVVYKIYDSTISVSGYESISVEENEETNTFTITCTDEPEILDKTIIIKWEDDNNNLKRTRNDVEVRLTSVEGIVVDCIVESEATDNWEKEISVRGYKDGELLNWKAELINYPNTYRIIRSETNSEPYTFILRCNHNWASNGICTYCGKNCKHSWSSNSNTHKCNICNRQEEHNYRIEGNEHVCVCGISHIINWSHDGDTHWCNNHENSSEPHDNSDGICVCGYCEHKYRDDGNKHVCIFCGDSHERYSWADEKEHKCSEKCNLIGIHTWLNGQCTVCGNTHLHDLEFVRTEEVCEKCEECGYIKTTHNYNEKWICMNCNYCKHIGIRYEPTNDHCNIYCTECRAFIGTRAHVYSGGRVSECIYCHNVE